MSKVATVLEQLRDQPDDELREQLVRNRDELFRLHLGQHTNQVTSTAQLKTKRREIAQIMTVLRGRQLGLEAQAQKTSTGTAESSDSGTTPAKTTKKTKKAKS